MENLNIKINYLYHSGFSVETEHHFLVFDYYRGPIQLNDKVTFIFSSHSHPDHFNPVIFEWQKRRHATQYILSSDIPVPPTVNHVHSLAPNEVITVDGLKVKAYNSTDIGVSFLVECEGLRLFHAGDLNWWYWRDTPEEMVKAEKGFKDEIKKLKGEQIDIAFFPVDPRLEENYSAGAEHFIQEIHPQFLIPMHFADDLQVSKTFAQKMTDSPTKVIEITHQGQQLNFSSTGNTRLLFNVAGNQCPD